MNYQQPRFCQTYKELDKGRGLDSVEYVNIIQPIWGLHAF